MKKLILLFFSTALFLSNYAQNVNVTATSGTLSASYLTLKAAFDKINNGTHKGTITITVVANTTEAASAVLNASGAGSANYTSVNIQPSGGSARTISGSLAAPLIDLNGADNVTIDGLNTGGNSLDISNTSTSSLTNTSTIRFIQDATNNTVTNCILEGAGTSAALGTIYFSNGTAAVVTGNDGNTISNSTITAAGGNLPINAIYSAGKSVAIDNSGISILNNNIQDYYNPIAASNGIFVASFSSAWTITGNKFFQSATRTATAGAANVHRGINIVTASGVGYTVSNNIIGYANASGTGVTTYDGAFANRFIGIEMTAGTSSVSDVQGNTINGISLSTTSAAGVPGIFCGISILGGNINIGTTAGNTIGATTGTAAVSITSSTTSGVIAGIYATSTGTVSIQNNNIGAIITGGTALIGYTFHGINTAGTGNFTISSNTIGSTATANSITIGINGTTTTGVCTFNGITNSSTGTASITNNTVQNCSVYGTGASVFNGIVNSGSTGALYITGNGIRFGTNTGTGNFFGITNSASATVASIYINSNIIRGHIRTAASGAFTGISNTGAATSLININTNQIGNINGGALTFTNASSGTITGISNNAGTATTTVNINGNSMDGFSVVSSGVFTGIINAGAATGIAININSNQIGTTTGNVITYSAANSTAITGISNTGGASTCALSIQSNDISGIVHSVAGTSAHTYIINSAATLSQSISTNTFTNLNVNTTGAVTFISNNVVVSGTQNVDGNSIVGSFARNSGSPAGALTLFTSSANSVSGAVISNSNNNFSNITVSGAATIAGWINTDAGAGTKTIQGNTFSNWSGGTGLITGMNVNISGAGNAISGNNINNFTSGGNINVITTGAGNDNIYSNIISSISSTGTGLTIVNGINVTSGTTKNIYQNTITGLHANFSNLSGNIQNSLAVDGILVSGGTTVNVSQNIISGFTADAIDAGTVNGITVSGGTTVTLFRNKIYDLSSNSTAINAGGISGLFVFSVAGSVTNIINNTIGDIRTPVSGNSDSYRGISINTNTVSDINVYFNTIYLNSTSTGANFGSTGIYHAFNANGLIGKLDLRNNIITNLSVPTGTGITALFRQYGAALNNYASTSNNNLYYAGTPGPKRVIFLIDPSSSDQTLPAFKARLVNREGQSFTEDVTVNFLSLVGSSPYFLHIDPTICTRLESGGINISGITDDYDGQIRQGNPGYIGTGTAPDIGADEFEGSAIPTANLNGTTTICNGSSAILTLTVTGTGTITGTLSDGTPFSGTAPIITVNVSPAITTTYTIATLTNGTCTSISSDMTGSAIVTVNARPTGVLSGTTSICNGNLATLSITATGTGTISGTLSDGTVFSGTAPTITIVLSPSSTTTYTITTLSDANCLSISGDMTGSATVTVNALPATPTLSAGGPLTFCAGGSVTLTSSAGTTYLWSTGATTSSISPTISGSYTVQVTNAAGCQSASSTATTVTVNALPATPTISAGGPLTFCTGGSVTLTSTAGTTYLWSTGATTSSISPTISGSYTVKVTNAAGCQSASSTATTVTVNALPATPTISAGGPLTFCAGGSVTLTSSAGTTYLWSTGATTSGISPAISGSYTVQVTNAAGCQSASSTATTVTVNALPATPTIGAGGPLTFCAGGSVTLTSSAGTTYLWSTGATTSSISPTTSGSYTVQVTNAAGCQSASSAATVVTVNARPTGAISGTVTICNGSNTNLTIAATGTGSISGTLSDGTAFSGTAPTITVSVSPSGTTTYTIATMTNGTCASIAGDKTGSATVSVTTPPSATISYATPFCYNTGSALVMRSGTVGGSYSSSPSGASINSGTGTLNLAASSPGQYTITYSVAPSGGCGLYTTNTVIVINPFTWTGGTSTDWNTAANWAGNIVPTTACADVTILSGVPYQPTLGSGFATIQNIIVNSGATLTVTNATLQIAGTISNSGTFDVSNGAIELNGSVAQTIPVNAFQNNALKDLIISNSSGGGVTLGGAVDVYGSLTYTGSGMKLTTNDFLALKSNATNTAWVGDMTGNTITGKVSVERYISAHKAWRFLSIPTNTTQTIRQTWQEGASGTGSNPVPGFGIQLTGAGGTGAGFDLYSATPSMKTYNPVTNGWVGVSSTANIIKSTDGYMVFVRGDRTANAFASPASQTVVRTKGDLYVGDQTPIVIAAGMFGAIGNPYASALDMRYITKTGVKNFFYLWDPSIGGNYGLGGYQTFSYNGSDYEVTPGLGSYGATGSVSNYIQSGQAFFVQATGSGGSVILKEAAKTTGSAQVSIAVRPTQSPVTSPVGLSQSKLRTNLYGVNADNSTYIVDGVLSNYGDDYSNNIDDEDAIKSVNAGENLSIKTNNQLLVIERRHSITQQDTIFLNLANTKVQKYRFEFAAGNLNQPGLTAYLEDSYLKTSTLLNLSGTTTIDFSVVNIAGSYATNRFRIVFTQAGVLPLTMTSVKAYQQNKNIAVEWTTANESNMKKYDVEKSPDGTHFITGASITAKNTIANSYNWLDEKTTTGYNYYRIKSTGVNGEIQYSQVVKVFMGTSRQEITVYPNPVTNNTINLQLVNQPAGNYAIKLLNNAGQQVLETTLQHTEGSSTELIPTTQKLPKGIYQLQVIKPDQSMVTNKLIF